MKYSQSDDKRLLTNTEIPAKLERLAVEEGLYMSERFAENNFNKITRTPFYFGEDGKQLMGWLHSSELSEPTGQCLIICPPLGIDYINCYRSMRYIADYFALSGIPTMRFDYHGTGDSSGSNVRGNRLPDWLNSIEQCRKTITNITGCSRVGLFGVRMGASMAAICAERSEYDFLILWAAVEKGKRYLREMKALQRTSAFKVATNTDVLEAGGFVYWPETAEEITKIDLSTLKPKVSNALIIPRDDLLEKHSFEEGWLSSGLNVEQLSLDGSSEMLLDAHLSSVPHQSIIKIVNWVVSLNSKRNVTETVDVDNKNVERYNFSFSGVDLKKQHFKNAQISNSKSGGKEIELEESMFRYGTEQKYFGICCKALNSENKNLPKIILLNAGATHRVSSNRLYVKLSRQLSGSGFETYRVDLPGLGDSVINERRLEHNEYSDTSHQAIESIIDSIKLHYPDSQFIVMGLCSGAYFSFQAALRTIKDNIIESILINPLVFYWDDSIKSANKATQNFYEWNDLRIAILRLSSWKKVLSFKINVISALMIFLKRLVVKIKSISRVMVDCCLPGKLKNRDGDLDSDLKKIINKPIRLTFILSKDDPGFDLLMTNASINAPTMVKNKEVEVHFIDNADHTFSMLKPRLEVIDIISQHLTDSYLT